MTPERLIWLVPLVVVVVGSWRPRAGLLALVVALPWFGAPPGGPYLTALDVACVAAILTGWRGGGRVFSPLTAPAAALVVVGLLSLVPSPYLPPSWRPTTLLALVQVLPGAESWSALYTWRSAVDLVLGFGLFLTVRRAFAGRSQRPLFTAILAGFVTVLALGLASEAGWLDLSGYRPVESSTGRMQSVFLLSGWFSQYLIVAAPPALAGLAAWRRWHRFLLPPLAAATLVGVALTQARGAMLAGGGELLAAALLLLKRRRLVPSWRVLAATAALVAVMVGVVVFASGSLREFDRPERFAVSFESRVPLWTSAVDMVRDRPLLGTGLGSFAPAYDRLNPEGSPRARPHHLTAHNLYLHVGAETGVIGFAALCLLGLSVAAGLRRAEARDRRWALAVGLSLVGVAVYGLIQHVPYLRPIHWLLWILLGSAALSAGTREIRHTRRVAQVIVLAALVALPLRLATAEPPRYGGDRELGLHETERNEGGEFRWTAANAMRRLERRDGDLVLSLANGHPLSARRPVTVAIGIDGEEVATVEVAGGWQEHRISLPPSTPESFVLTLRASPTFRPFSEFRRLDPPIASTDVRRLGVAVREVRWEP